MSSRSKKTPATEYVTAEEIQRGFQIENAAIEAEQASRSAIKSERARRDRHSAPRKPRRGEITVLRSALLAEIPWLVHGFSTRQGGVSEAYGGNQLNLGFTAQDTREAVEANRALFLRQLTGEEKIWPLASVHQIHSPAIFRLRRGEVLPHSGDGLITSARRQIVSIRTADCVPVIVADRKKRAVGVFHAGWRGTVARIVEKGVGEMRLQLGCQPRNLVACIGPCIGSCCYSIGEEVEEAFDSQFAYSKELFENVFDSWSLSAKYPLLFLNQRAPGHGEPAMARHLNLVEANRRQLLDAGLPEANVESLNLCTSCRTDMFFSYRKEGNTGRMMAAAGIR